MSPDSVAAAVYWYKLKMDLLIALWIIGGAAVVVFVLSLLSRVSFLRRED